jgi:hypothetical protein
VHWADFLHTYQSSDNTVATARRWQEDGQARRLREAYLPGHPQVDAKQLTFSP